MDEDALTGKQREMARIKSIFRKLRAKVAGFFQPEEVEVTFSVKGKNITYTYTKVDHKQVA